MLFLPSTVLDPSLAFQNTLTTKIHGLHSDSQGRDIRTAYSEDILIEQTF